MQQQQQQQPGGGPHQFGAPPSEMAAFPSSSGTLHLHTPKQSQPAEAASPINSRPPPPPPPHPPSAAANFDELSSSVAGGFPDEEALAAGDEAERGGPAGNRWPQQETLALLKIRSEMDAAFRDATFKGPLWEEVSRKLAELDYKRSAKKCKEKFENVLKYYKRTKEGRAGRQDGKNYRFFTELEALHNTGAGVSATTPTATAAPPLAAASPTTFTFTTPMVGPPTARIQPMPISAVAPPLVTPSTRVIPDLSPPVISTSVPAAAAAAGISFSFESSASSSSESEEEDVMGEAGGSRGGRKRKRAGGGSRYQRRMMTFFEGLMKQVMERQEAMQQRFLEAIEKREQDRMKREEAWRLQEMTRLSREQELLAHERAMAAARDTAVISYLQKISGQPILFPTIPATAVPTTVSTPLSARASQPPSAAPTPQPVNPTAPLQPSASSQQKHETPRHNQASQDDRPQPSPATMQLAPISIEPPEGLGSGGFELASSSRWPKAEVHALIKLRSGLESKYQEAGPKGPLWEEIATGMQRMGYNRSAKRCKEKWENINKYFKKVKESNKKRAEDSKTCPYFHQLDALYRQKQQHGGVVGSSSSGAGAQNQQDAAQEETQIQPPPDSQGKNGNRNGGNSDGGGGSNGNNGGHTQSYMEEGMKKPEDIVKELMARQQQQQQQQGVMDDYDKMDDADSDNLDQDDEDDDDEDDEDSKMQYKIQFQRQNVSSGGGGGGGGSSTSAAATQAGSFLAMVQ